MTQPTEQASLTHDDVVLNLSDRLQEVVDERVHAEFHERNREFHAHIDRLFADLEKQVGDVITRAKEEMHKKVEQLLPHPEGAYREELLQKRVHDFDLSLRTKRIMIRLGIVTVGDLIQKTPDELLEAKNFGISSLHEIREALRSLGLFLKGEAPIRTDA